MPPPEKCEAKIFFQNPRGVREQIRVLINILIKDRLGSEDILKHLQHHQCCQNNFCNIQNSQ